MLILSNLQVYPPIAGGTLRTVGLATALKRHGLPVFVYSLAGRWKDYLARQPSSIQRWPEGVEEYVDRGPVSFLGQYLCSVLRLPPVWVMGYFRAAAASPREVLLPARLRAALATSDVLVVDFPFASRLFAAPSARGLVHVLSTHNVEHHLYPERGSVRNRWLRGFVRRTEIRAAWECDILVTCSDSDRQFFEDNARVRHSVVVPNGIDFRRFAGNRAQRAAVRGKLGIADDALVFLFTGSRWAPNHEAFVRLVDFARENGPFLAERRVHILVVGGVTPVPVTMPGFTATGKVDQVEPYFAAADAALNPLAIGAGTNVKMSEFLALRLPVATTRLGARGFRIEDGKTGFLFEVDDLRGVLSRIRGVFDESPGRLREIAEAAYLANEGVIDMERCVVPLLEAFALRGDPRREKGRGL